MLNQKLTGASSAANYIEDVFSTYLYTGNGSTQTITNGIDLAGKGGLVWIKGRNTATNNLLADTNQGATKWLDSAFTDATHTTAQTLTSFNSDGFSLGNDYYVNYSSSNTYASWTFRKQPKFFDVVTATKSGSTVTFNHNLGVAPGMVIIKATNGVEDWVVYHKSLGTSSYLLLNSTLGTQTYANIFTVSSTQFVLNAASYTNYVAYFFADNAGGFGSTGTDNVISCGSYTGNGAAGNSVTLGYEPQWILVKEASGTSASSNNWVIQDTMRGFVANASGAAYLSPNTSGAESTGNIGLQPTATGFVTNGGGSAINESGGTYIYIAIRRGPMKVPTDGTTVFNTNKQNTTGTTTAIPSGFPPDLVVAVENPSAFGLWDWQDRLRGSDGSLAQQVLQSSSTSAEVASSGRSALTLTSAGFVYQSAITNLLTWAFKRAPGFFDEVCYTGDGTVGRQIPHNLGVAPELMIVKARNGTYGVNTYGWRVYVASVGPTKYMSLEGTAAPYPYGDWNDTNPTSSVFTVWKGDTSANPTNRVTIDYVAYLFATCPGVSKVGSYTGNGSSQTINCGFSAGARFILIKRTDSTGDWYVWDTARGIVSGNDPHLSLNTTSAEVTTDDTIDPDSTGFIVNQVSGIDVNVSSATYIYLAIA